MSDHHGLLLEAGVLAWEDDVEAHALREQGWSISAIARHLGHDRKTVRAYLQGARSPGRRVRTAPSVIEPFLEYCRIRLADDPHLWASTLLDELVDLGFTGSYPSLTATIRALGLRPHCEPCQAAKGRDVSIIHHPPGEETQFDWIELPNPPPGWGAGRHAHLLVGALSHSGRWRAVLAESEQFPQLVEALDAVVRRLGGLTRRWRFDRMATVCHPHSGHVTAAFAQVAKHYAVAVDVCPSRRGNRKGVVEKANHAAAQRWWRTLADDANIEAAQAGLDRRAASLDRRRRVRDGARLTVADLADAEPLRPAPTVIYPASLEVERTVSPQALVSFRGNRYSVPPGLPGALVTVRHRLGSPELDVITASGAVVARHHRAPDGSGAVVRDHGHVVALERAVLAQFSTARPCTHKTRRPPSPAALDEAHRLEASRLEAGRLAAPNTATGSTTAAGRDLASRVVIDLAAYAALVPEAARTARPAPPALNPLSGSRSGVEEDI